MGHFRQAVRQLIKHAGASMLTIALLAIGIGSTTAIFSLFHTILLRPLPVTEPQALVNFVAPGAMWGSYNMASAGDAEHVFSYGMFRDLEAEQTPFTGIAGHRHFPVNLSDGEQVVSGTGLLVSGGYFDILGLRPALGRLISPADDDVIGQSPVAVLAYDYWQTAFGGSGAAIGEAIEVNGQRLTVIGVAPEGFAGTTIGTQVEVFVPLTLRWLLQPAAIRDETNRNSYWVYLFARLRSGMPTEQATAQINGLYKNILREVDAPRSSFLRDDIIDRFLAREIVLEPGGRGQSTLPGNTRLSLALLLGITALVLIIVCVNVANLMLVRGAARAGELAVRASLGASRRRLIAQLLTEASILGGTGGLAGLPLAALTLQLVRTMTPQSLAAGLPLVLSTQALLFASAVTLATVLVFGLVPALRSSTIDLDRLVRGYAANVLGSSGNSGRLRASLATAQVAFSMILLVLAGLFAMSLIEISRVDPGFEVDRIMTFNIAPRLNGYDSERVMATFDAIESALAEAPGISAVTSSSVALLSGINAFNLMSVDGFEAGPGVDSLAAGNWVSPSFFGTLSIPVRYGRVFADSDAMGAPKAAIVNESFVRKFDLNGAAIGTRVGTLGPRGEQDIEIVGVVADAQYSNVKDDIPAQIFLPRRQNENLPAMTFYVRSALPPDVLAPMIRSTVGGIDGNLPINRLTTLRTAMGENVYRDRMITLLSTAFAMLAVLLAAIGLYGVVTHGVLQRTREFGLRLALGATPASLRSTVFRHAGKISIVGIAIGVLGAVPIGRLAQSLLFGLSGQDWRMIVAAAATLAVATFAAACIPARRAMRIAPMEALRQD